MKTYILTLCVPDSIETWEVTSTVEIAFIPDDIHDEKYNAILRQIMLVNLEEKK